MKTFDSSILASKQSIQFRSHIVKLGLDHRLSYYNYIQQQFHVVMQSRIELGNPIVFQEKYALYQQNVVSNYTSPMP